MRMIFPVLSLAPLAGCGGSAWPDLSVLPVGRGDRAEVDAKLTRVRMFLKDEGLDGMVFHSTWNFAWLTAGGENVVAVSRDAGPVSLLVTQGHQYLIAGNNEVPRFEREEVQGLGFETRSFNWWEEAAGGAKGALVLELTRGMRIGTDLPFMNFPVMEDRLARVRAALMEPEIARYRWLGRTVTEAVEATAREIAPGETEAQISARLSDRLKRWNITPTVLLNAVDTRVLLFRHPLSKEARLEKLALLAVCARKWGLVACVSRFVHFGPVPEALRAKFDIAETVYATCYARSRPGATLGDVFQAGVEAYARAGCPEEWQLHHQGGATGYRERTALGFEESTWPITPGQAMAWNPTCQGAKVENTFLVLPEGNEVLTTTGTWPTRTIRVGDQTVECPVVLIR